MGKYTGINTGKICKLEIIKAADIDHMITDLDQHLSTVALLPGSAWTEIVCTDETIELKVTEDGDDDGSTPFKRVEITAEVPKVTAERITFIQDRQLTPLLVRITDIEGRKFLAGTPESPSLLNYHYGIGRQAKEANTIHINITAYSATGLMEEHTW